MYRIYFLPFWPLIVPMTSCLLPADQYPEALINSNLQFRVWTFSTLHCIWHSPYKSAHLSEPELNKLWMHVVIWKMGQVLFENRFFLLGIWQIQDALTKKNILESKKKIVISCKTTFRNLFFNLNIYCSIIS